LDLSPLGIGELGSEYQILTPFDLNIQPCD